MPDRPYRICAYPRCGTRTRERYCPAHKALAAREYNQSRTNRKHAATSSGAGRFTAAPSTGARPASCSTWPCTWWNSGPA